MSCRISTGPICFTIVYTSFKEKQSYRDSDYNSLCDGVTPIPRVIASLAELTELMADISPV